MTAPLHYSAETRSDGLSPAATAFAAPDARTTCWTPHPPVGPGRYFYRDPAETVIDQECHVEHAPDLSRHGLVARFPLAVFPLEALTGEWAGPVAEPR